MQIVQWVLHASPTLLPDRAASSDDVREKESAHMFLLLQQQYGGKEKGREGGRKEERREKESYQTQEGMTELRGGFCSQQATPTAVSHAPVSHYFGCDRKVPHSLFRVTTIHQINDYMNLHHRIINRSGFLQDTPASAHRDVHPPSSHESVSEAWSSQDGWSCSSWFLWCRFMAVHGFNDLGVCCDNDLKFGDSCSPNVMIHRTETSHNASHVSLCNDN